MRKCIWESGKCMSESYPWNTRFHTPIIPLEYQAYTVSYSYHTLGIPGFILLSYPLKSQVYTQFHTPIIPFEIPGIHTVSYSYHTLWNPRYTHGFILLSYPLKSQVYTRFHTPIILLSYPWIPDIPCFILLSYPCIGEAMESEKRGIEGES